MSTMIDSVVQNSPKKSWEEKAEILRKKLDGINGRNGRINCVRVALATDEVMCEGSRKPDAKPVGTQRRHVVFHPEYENNDSSQAIHRTHTNDLPLLERIEKVGSHHRPKDFKDYIDLTTGIHREVIEILEGDSEKPRYSPELMTDDDENDNGKTQNKSQAQDKDQDKEKNKDKTRDKAEDKDKPKGSSEKAPIEWFKSDEESIIESLKKLPRRKKDGSAHGFLIYTAVDDPDENSHIANFELDKDNDAFFIDAQLKDREARVSKTPATVGTLQYKKDIFFINSMPPEGFLPSLESVAIKQEPQDDDIKVKMEIVDPEMGSEQERKEDDEDRVTVYEPKFLFAATKSMKGFLQACLDNNEKQVDEYLRMGGRDENCVGEKVALVLARSFSSLPKEVRDFFSKKQTVGDSDYIIQGAAWGAERTLLWKLIEKYNDHAKRKDTPKFAYSTIIACAAANDEKLMRELIEKGKAKGETPDLLNCAEGALLGKKTRRMWRLAREAEQEAAANHSSLPNLQRLVNLAIKIKALDVVTELKKEMEKSGQTLDLRASAMAAADAGHETLTWRFIKDYQTTLSHTKTHLMKECIHRAFKWGFGTMGFNLAFRTLSKYYTSDRESTIILVFPLSRKLLRPGKLSYSAFNFLCLCGVIETSGKQHISLFNKFIQYYLVQGTTGAFTSDEALMIEIIRQLHDMALDKKVRVDFQNLITQAREAQNDNLVRLFETLKGEQKQFFMDQQKNPQNASQLGALSATPSNGSNDARGNNSSGTSSSTMGGTHKPNTGAFIDVFAENDSLKNQVTAHSLTIQGLSTDVKNLQTTMQLQGERIRYLENTLHALLPQHLLQASSLSSSSYVSPLNQPSSYAGHPYLNPIQWMQQYQPQSSAATSLASPTRGEINLPVTFDYLTRTAPLVSTASTTPPENRPRGRPSKRKSTAS